MQAFQGLVRPLLAKSEAELAGWREALQQALGSNARLVVDLVPEVKLIIGEPAPLTDLPPQDAQRRFQLVLRRFIGVFARAEHPLALFLDDLQWLDAATLDLIEDLMTQPDVRHLLLIGAYRDNEVGALHPLRRKLVAIRQAQAAVQEISLGPLAGDDVGQLMADALRCERAHAMPLAQLVHEKTGGNPFFVIQFLSALVENGLLFYDHVSGRWSWDPERIHAQGYTDNVVELVVGRLARLGAPTQEALRQLACLGSNAELTRLSLILGTSEDELHAQLADAVAAELVERQDSAYRFIHDRVREAAYSLIPEDARAAAHLRIGRLLAAHTPADKREESIFEIVGQLNRGAELITSSVEREHLAELNLIAGKRAKASAAHASALTYLAAGAHLLSEDAWERRHELVFALELHRAQCEFLTGSMAEAEQRLAVLAGRAANLPDLATVARSRMELFTTLGEIDRTVEVCLDYLQHVGVRWAAHPTVEEVRDEYERISRQLGERRPESLLDLPRMVDPVARGTMDVLSALLSAARCTDENLRWLTIGRMVNLSLEHGNSDASCTAYALLSLAPQIGDYRPGCRFGQLGLELVEQRGLDRYKARVYMNFAIHVQVWTGHVKASSSAVAAGLRRSASGRRPEHCGLLPPESGRESSRRRRPACAGAAGGRGRSRFRPPDALWHRRRQHHHTAPADPHTAWRDSGLRPLRRRAAWMRRGSSGICRRMPAWRSPHACTGSASCRRASSPAIMLPRSRPHPKHNRCCGRWRLSSTWPSTIFTLRLRARHCVTLLLYRPGTWTRWPATTASSRNGRGTAPRPSGIASRWSARSSLASTAAMLMQCASTKTPCARRAPTATSTTRPSRTRRRHASTGRAAARRSPTCTCATPAAAT